MERWIIIKGFVKRGSARDFIYASAKRSTRLQTGRTCVAEDDESEDVLCTCIYRALRWADAHRGSNHGVKEENIK